MSGRRKVSWVGGGGGEEQVDEDAEVKYLLSFHFHSQDKIGGILANI